MAKNKTKKRFNKTSAFQTALSTIITMVIFVIVAILLSCGIDLVFSVDIYFWSATIGNTIAIILTFITWCPTGERMALKLSKVKNAIMLYNVRANYIIQNQMFDELKDFCDKKNAENEREIITDLLSEQTVNYEVYSLYCNKERTEDEEKRYTKIWNNCNDKQKKLVKKLACKKVKFEKLTPKNITIGTAEKHTVVNHNREAQYKAFRLSTKTIWGIFTTCFTYFVVIKPNEEFGIPQVVMMFTWFFVFLMAIYAAINTGYKSIEKYQHRYNREQCQLCAEFFKVNDTPMNEVDKPYIEWLENEKTEILEGIN